MKGLERQTEIHIGCQLLAKGFPAGYHESQRGSLDLSWVGTAVPRSERPPRPPAAGRRVAVQASLATPASELHPREAGCVSPPPPCS